MTTKVRSPLTGIVLAISVKVGDAVSAGDELALLESMKMEFPVQAPAQGLVSEVCRHGAARGRRRHPFQA